MDKSNAYLLWFEQLERKDVDIVGGKSSSLGEMTSKTDVPVPYGFATTSGELDDAVDALSGIFQDMLRLAQIEKTSQLLAEEIEKTRRRVRH